MRNAGYIALLYMYMHIWFLVEKHKISLYKLSVLIWYIYLHRISCNVTLWVTKLLTYDTYIKTQILHFEIYTQRERDQRERESFSDTARVCHKCSQMYISFINQQSILNFDPFFSNPGLKMRDGSKQSKIIVSYTICNTVHAILTSQIIYTSIIFVEETFQQN